MSKANTSLRKIFFTKMALSLLIQVLVLAWILWLIDSYLVQRHYNDITEHLIIHDPYNVQQLENYALLKNQYAFNLELHNLLNWNRLDRISFSKYFQPHDIKHCQHSLKPDYWVCHMKHDYYMGITPLRYNKKTLGYIITQKRYHPIKTPISDILLLMVIVIIISFVLNFTLLFLSMRRRIEKNTRYLIESITDCPSKSIKMDIDEYKIIANEFYQERKKIINLEKEKFYNKTLADLAAQIAHDIRSPLAALNTAIKYADCLPEQQKNLIKNVSNRINEIADNLLKEYHSKGSGSGNDNSATQSSTHELLLSPLLESLVREKKLQYEDHDIEFKLSITDSARFSCCNINAAQIKRVLSNIINNSVEAIDKKSGLINIQLDYVVTNAVLTITDNGCGISKEQLPHVHKQGISNKENGTGLGLPHAIRILKCCGGKLKLDSEPGQGTTATLWIPASHQSNLYLSQITVSPNRPIAILDDVQSIHDIWLEKLSPYKKQLELHHFTEPRSFIEWYSENSEQQPLVLSDYELQDEQVTGLYLLEKLKIDNAILVTSHHEKMGIIERCLSLQIKLLPKSLLPYISIILTDIV